MMDTAAITATSIMDLAKGYFDEPGAINVPERQDDGRLTSVNTVYHACPISMH